MIKSAGKSGALPAREAEHRCRAMRSSEQGCRATAMPIRSVRGGYGEALVVGSQISGKRGEDILIVETRRMQKINSIWLLTMTAASGYIAGLGCGAHRGGSMRSVYADAVRWSSCHPPPITFLSSKGDCPSADLPAPSAPLVPRPRSFSLPISSRRLATRRPPGHCATVPEAPAYRVRFQDVRRRATFVHVRKQFRARRGGNP